MSELLANPWGLLLVVASIGLLVGIIATALGQAAARPTPSPDPYWDAWVDQALRLSDTPLYDATAAHLAKHAAQTIETEWAELNGDAS